MPVIGEGKVERIGDQFRVVADQQSVKSVDHSHDEREDHHDEEQRRKTGHSIGALRKGDVFRIRKHGGHPGGRAGICLYIGLGFNDLIGQGAGIEAYNNHVNNGDKRRLGPVSLQGAQRLIFKILVSLHKEMQLCLLDKFTHFSHICVC